MAGDTSTHKKVVIHRFEKAIIKGFVNLHTYLGPSSLELLDTEGHLLTLPLEEVKGVYFVRDFEGDPPRPERRVFHSRPRLTGLWIRMIFKDSEIMEGLISKNLMEMKPQGFLVTPPDFSSNSVRVYIPRSALSRLEVLGVISNGTARRTAVRAGRGPGKPPDAAQIGLFSSLESSETKG